MKKPFAVMILFMMTSCGMLPFMAQQAEIELEEADQAIHAEEAALKVISQPIQPALPYSPAQQQVQK